MIIRTLLLLGLAATGWLIFLRRNRLPVHILTVFFLLGLGALAIVWPELADEAAKTVGVGRGADLVMYTTVVAVMFVLLHYYTKFVELQTQITQLTRELAIMKAESERAASSSDSNK